MVIANFNKSNPMSSNKANDERTGDSRNSGKTVADTEKKTSIARCYVQMVDDEATPSKASKPYSHGQAKNSYVFVFAVPNNDEENSLKHETQKGRIHSKWRLKATAQIHRTSRNYQKIIVEAVKKQPLKAECTWSLISRDLLSCIQQTKKVGQLNLKFSWDEEFDIFKSAVG